ncbi:DNA repair protein RadA [Patescibacteria group bacterium]
MHQVVKSVSVYICQQCEHKSSKWYGKCPQCDSWGSLVETLVERPKGGKGKTYQGVQKTRSVSLSSISSRKIERSTTNISELDRVLGGGVVPGQVVLIAGEPGIGKSTILLQVSDKMGNILYTSGEESVQQLAIRAKRLKVKRKTIKTMEETDVDAVIDETLKDNKIKLLIIDSIQTMQTSDLSGMAGSVGQVRECAHRLVRFAKRSGVSVFIVGHVTKQGSVAGPALLSHIVDTVLWFEGDKSLSLRLLRAVKNRFGPTDEVGIFSMQDVGLVSETNPEKLFLSKGRQNPPGSAISVALQGTRPILIEIQALVVPTKTPFPRRIAQGINPKRFELLLAVLTRRAGIPLYDNDCYVNISGGIDVKETAIDLAICLAVASAYFDKPLERGTVVIGETGLLGDIREVSSQEKRIKEAKRLGFKYPISYKEVKYLSQAIRKYLK